MTTYTITSAAYANADHTAAVLQTEEAAAVLASRDDTPELWQQMLDAGPVADYVEPVYVPQAVSRAQAKIALLRAGVSSAMVEGAISAMPPGQARDEALIWWQDAQDFQRDNPLLQSLAQGMGLDLDELFIAAAAVK